MRLRDVWPLVVAALVFGMITTGLVQLAHKPTPTTVLYDK